MYEYCCCLDVRSIGTNAALVIKLTQSCFLAIACLTREITGWTKCPLRMVEGCQGGHILREKFQPTSADWFKSEDLPSSASEAEGGSAVILASDIENLP